jgi:hypothetical protein
VGGEEPIKVRLLFEPKLAVYITERQWHPTQEFLARHDGRIEMRLETTGRKELVRWILSWMPDVKVLAPKSLRDRIAEKLRDGLRAQQRDTACITYNTRHAFHVKTNDGADFVRCSRLETRAIDRPPNGPFGVIATHPCGIPP